MPVLKSSDGYVCYRCWRRLISPRTKPSRRSATTSYHTSSWTSQEHITEQREAGYFPRYKRLRSTAPIDQRSDDGRPQPQGWRALLQNKSLGEAASVLVLRDTEEKKSSRRKQVNTDEKSGTTEELDVEKMLESLKGQVVDPAQSEVNSSINAIKPDTIAALEDRPAMISEEVYGQLVKQLSDAFNQTQLARYITHTLTSNAQPAVPSNVDHTLWQPTDSKRKRVPRGRGKRALAHSIVRSVWLLEVREEVEREGLLDIRLDRDRFSLAQQDDKIASLQQLETSKKVKIETIETKNSLRITGHKYDAIGAAEDVEAILYKPFDVELDVGPLKAFSQLGTTDEAAIQQMAMSYSCTVKWKNDSTRRILQIRGRDKNCTNALQRGLLAQCHFQYRSKDVLTSFRPLDEGLVTRLPSDERAPRTNQARNEGRFTNSFRISRGEHGAPKQLSSPNRLPVELVDSVRNHVADSALFGVVVPDHATVESSPLDASSQATRTRWQGGNGTRIDARFGHVLHPIEVGSLVRHTSVRELLHVDNTEAAQGTASHPKLTLKEPPTFVPGMIGFPHTLQQSLYSDLQHDARRRLLLCFYPSPWVYACQALHALPTVQMELALHTRDRHIEITKLTSTFGTRNAYLMLPNLGTDIAVTRRDFLTLAEASSDASVQKFLDAVKTSYSTTGQLYIPSSLSLGVPSYMMISGALRKEPALLEALRSQQDEVELQYCATSAVDERELTFPFEDHELVYTHSRDVDSGQTSEGISLRCKQDPSLEPNTSGDEIPLHLADGTKVAEPTVDLRGFLNTTQNLLRQLSIGTGKTQRMDDYVKRAAKGKRPHGEEAPGRNRPVLRTPDEEGRDDGIRML